MCNRPDRLAEALAPLPLTLAPPVGCWGLGSVHGGEVLIARTPRPAEGPLDLGAAIVQQRSDCVIAQVDGSRPDDLPPFRFRRWMLAADPTGPLPAALAEPLIARLPEFLRRNLRGRTPGEIALHTLIALLHEEGLTDEAALQVPVLARATAAAIARVADGLAAAGLPGAVGNVAVSNSRALAVAALAAPLAVYPLRVFTERGQHDPSFRGVVVSSGLGPPVARGDAADAVPEHVPVGSLVTVSRDLQLAITPLHA